ncbi:Oncoprotein-induced transcript 3 protein [Exaiptasia diaphana]|nr:Oncoprotein-induced transcript 3 protein [Exaiptasia diaphana]
MQSVQYFAEEECSDAANLTSEDRSLWYSSYNDMKCDLGLQDGWYRFTGHAGTEMATSCVAMYHCGTQYPGWLLGSHPAATDGRINKTVCFTKDSNCCYWSTNVTVRNCSGFYVYKLKQKPRLCPYRLCGQTVSILHVYQLKV